LAEHDIKRRLGAEAEASAGRRLLKDVLETIILALLIYAGLRFLVRNFRIDGSSMEPSLHHGQLIVIARWSYWFQTPKRGDVIVFSAPNAKNRDLVKRVVGLPGEQISVRNGQVFVDGEQIQEPYAQPGQYTGGSWTLGENELFVMGDNRSRSQDSRSWGPLQTSRIVGKGLVCYWPPRLWGVVPHHSF
jgi:signal peptidase I